MLNRRDDCCFGEQFHRADLTGMSFDQATHSYEWRVRGTISTLPTGSFRLEIDESAPAHMISWSNIANVILAELDEDRRTVGARSTADAFVRGMNGNLVALRRRRAGKTRAADGRRARRGRRWQRTRSTCSTATRATA